MQAAPTLPGRLAENVMHFGRVLRAAGMPVGTDRIQAALQALQVAGLQRRDDFHAVLSACLLDRIEHRALFDQAFDLFWRDRGLDGRTPASPLPGVQTKGGAAPAPEKQRHGQRTGDHDGTPAFLDWAILSRCAALSPAVFGVLP